MDASFTISLAGLASRERDAQNVSSRDVPEIHETELSDEALMAAICESRLAALSPENYDERVSGAAYLTMSMPAYQLS